MKWHLEIMANETRSGWIELLIEKKRKKNYWRQSKFFVFSDSTCTFVRLLKGKNILKLLIKTSFHSPSPNFIYLFHFHLANSLKDETFFYLFAKIKQKKKIIKHHLKKFGCFCSFKARFLNFYVHKKDININFGGFFLSFLSHSLTRRIKSSISHSHQLYFVTLIDFWRFCL